MTRQVYPGMGRVRLLLRGRCSILRKVLRLLIEICEKRKYVFLEDELQLRLEWCAPKQGVYSEHSLDVRPEDELSTWIRTY